MAKIPNSDMCLGLTHEEILAQSILFFLAGYDTTANTLALFAYELAVHSEIQDRLIQEIDEVMKDEVDVVSFAIVYILYYLLSIIISHSSLTSGMLISLL